ncbi:MAG: NAD(P)/FAD-dependent oxidoreductase [Nitrospirota bacterium]|nr:NAD(P)/FAD-dependent oxidoreductase [Nitrospirota bacterium]
MSARIEQFLPTDFKSVVEEEINRLQFTYGPEKSYFIDSGNPFVFMVMRSRFDQWLVNKAQAEGTVIHEGEGVTHLTSLPDGVEVRTLKGRYFGRVVVGADGAMSVVAQQLFPGRRLRKIPALESEILFDVTNQPVTPDRTATNGSSKLAVISLNAAKKGYGWIFPKKNGLSIGVGEFVQGESRPKRSFQQFVREDPDLSKWTVPQPIGHPIPICQGYPNGKGARWNGGFVHHRALLVGDAENLVDPLLGEGILYAVRSGQLAAGSITSYLGKTQTPLEEYETVVIQEFGSEFSVAARLNKVIYGLPRSWHRWLGRTFPGPYQGLLRRYCGMLQGQETYQTLWTRIMQRLKMPFTSSSVRSRIPS